MRMPLPPMPAGVVLAQPHAHCSARAHVRFALIAHASVFLLRPLRAQVVAHAWVCISPAERPPLALSQTVDAVVDTSHMPIDGSDFLSASNLFALGSAVQPPLLRRAFTLPALLSGIL